MEIMKISVLGAETIGSFNEQSNKISVTDFDSLKKE
jgi:hypothetical protein